MQTVEDLRKELQGSIEDAQGDYPDVSECDIHFELAIGVALGADDREVAKEFLRAEFGYVPDTYKGYLA